MASNQDDTTVQVNKEELRRAGDLVIPPPLILPFDFVIFFVSVLFFFCFLVRIPTARLLRVAFEDL